MIVKLSLGSHGYINCYTAESCPAIYRGIRIGDKPFLVPVPDRAVILIVSLIDPIDCLYRFNGLHDGRLLVFDLFSSELEVWS